MTRDDEGTPVASDGMSSWSDARLLTAACGAERSAAALDILVRRHARALERRCRVIAGDRDRAADLAQETWSRMMRARAMVSADGSFRAYLAAIARNLWKDQRRASAHELALDRVLSIDAPTHDDGEGRPIRDLIAESSSDEEALLLRMDLRYALARLPARLRAVVIARYIVGEPAAHIGRRYARTEQTITAWLREAAARMQHDLRDWRSAA